MFNCCASYSPEKELPTTTAPKRFAKFQKTPHSPSSDRPKYKMQLNWSCIWIKVMALLIVFLSRFPWFSVLIHSNKVTPMLTIDEIFQSIQEHHEVHQNTTYTFDHDAEQLLQQMNTEFIKEVNTAILDGNMPPKSDHLPRIAVALYVLNYATEMLLLGQAIDDCPTVITSETISKANTFVMHIEQQKHS